MRSALFCDKRIADNAECAIRNVGNSLCFLRFVDVCGLGSPYTDVLDRELFHNSVITGDLLMTEFMQGFRNDKDFEAAKEIALYLRSCCCK